MNIDRNSILAKELATELAKQVEKFMISCLRTCVTCDNFTEKTEICKLANARPPAAVIASGCSSYDEKVPF